MGKYLVLSIVFILSLAGCSSSKDDITLSKSRLYNIARDWEEAEFLKEGVVGTELSKKRLIYPKFELVLAEKLGAGITCSHYKNPLGCQGAFTVKVRKVEFICIQFDLYSNALSLAKKINGYIRHNWVFDDVTGEPVLEDFIKNTFKAEFAAELANDAKKI